MGKMKGADWIIKSPWFLQLWSVGVQLSVTLLLLNAHRDRTVKSIAKVKSCTETLNPDIQGSMDNYSSRNTAEMQEVEMPPMKDGFISDTEQSENTPKTGKHKSSTIIEPEDADVSDLASSDSDLEIDDDYDDPVTTIELEEAMDFEKLNQATLFVL